LVKNKFNNIAIKFKAGHVCVRVPASLQSHDADLLHPFPVGHWYRNTDRFLNDVCVPVPASLQSHDADLHPCPVGLIGIKTLIGF
jgi:hypothetical protein